MKFLDKLELAVINCTPTIPGATDICHWDIPRRYSKGIPQDVRPNSTNFAEKGWLLLLQLNIPSVGPSRIHFKIQWFLRVTRQDKQGQVVLDAVLRLVQLLSSPCCCCSALSWQLVIHIVLAAAAVAQHVSNIIPRSTLSVILEMRLWYHVPVAPRIQSKYNFISNGFGNYKRLPEYVWSVSDDNPLHSILQ